MFLNWFDSSKQVRSESASSNYLTAKSFVDENKLKSRQSMLTIVIISMLIVTHRSLTTKRPELGLRSPSTAFILEPAWELAHVRPFCLAHLHGAEGYWKAFKIDWKQFAASSEYLLHSKGGWLLRGCEIESKSWNRLPWNDDVTSKLRQIHDTIQALHPCPLRLGNNTFPLNW